MVGGTPRNGPRWRGLELPSRPVRPVARFLRAVLIGAPLLVGGCAAVPGEERGRPPRADADRLCAPRAGGRPAAPLGEPLSAEAFRAVAERLAALGFSRAAIEIADAIGAAEPLQRLASLEAEGPRTAAA